MKLWVDDIREAPSGYVHAHSTEEAKTIITNNEWFFKSTRGNSYYKIEIIDIDHDAGEYVSDGGDYIKLLDWLEETGRNYPIHIHSLNPVGVENMRAIIQRNGWIEII